MNVLSPQISNMKSFRDQAVNYLASLLPDTQIPNPPTFGQNALFAPSTWQEGGQAALNFLIPQPEDTPFGLMKPLIHISKPFSYGQLRELPNEVLEAINNTPGARLNPEGNLTLHVSRYQKPEQFGDISIRNGVFYLPELKSPYQKYYSGGKYGYGGGDRFEGITTIENPLIAKAGTGGIAPIDAYDYLKGKKAYDAMRSEVLKNTITWNKPVSEQAIEDILIKFGGNPELAYNILSNSRGGNLLPYAIQENIVANAVKNAGYDSVLGVSKANKAPRLSELFDVRSSYYPDYGENVLQYPDFYSNYNR